VILSQGQPMNLPDVTVTEPDRRRFMLTSDAARAYEREIAQPFRGLTNAPSRGVTPTMAGSYWGIDRSVDARPLQWSTPQPSLTIDDVLRAGEAMARIRDDRVDSLEYSWRYAWGDPRSASVKSFPPGHYEASLAATHVVRGMLALSIAGQNAIAAARRLAEREGGWRALTALGAVGRSIVLALESNYGTALRGALLDLSRGSPTPAADLEPSRGALIELW